MFSPMEFRDLVSGQRRGLGASVSRCALRVAECGYTAAVRWRNRRYDRGQTAIHRLDVPVISVGNLTLGGTGKTPMVQWIARWFRQRGVRVAIVSRGYGADPDAAAGRANDEALEMQQLLPDVPHLQNPDRLAAAREAIARHGAQLIVLDDGFQHRRVARDLNIVLLDALEPFGFGHVFPRGMLREPIEGLRRADVVVLSRADQLVGQVKRSRDEIWAIVRAHAPAAVRVEAAHAPRTLVSSSGQETPLATIQGQPVAGFCGIGNPAGFRRTLEACGCRLVGFREYPDHHRYTPQDLDQLSEWSRGLGVAALVCTGKDLVKVPRDRLGNVPLWALRIEMELLAGADALESRLGQICPKEIAGG
ncbi:MAG: tetraacyldisaccharide 4'-kinase [Thermoguttaceae bacterium]